MTAVGSDQGVMRIKNRYGLATQLAPELGLDVRTIYEWRTIPLSHVFRVSAFTKIPVELLRPDFFINDPLRTAAAAAALEKPPQKKTKYKPRVPTRKLLTDKHRAMWFDIKTYPTSRLAADAIGNDINRVVNPEWIRIILGPSGRTPGGVAGFRTPRVRTGKFVRHVRTIENRPGSV